MLVTLLQDDSDSERGLRPTNRVFIAMNTIMFLDKISTLPLILTQIMVVLDSFGDLRCGNILSGIYSTIQVNNYLAPFSLYFSNSAKHQFMSKIITSSTTILCFFCTIIEAICITALKIMFIGAVLLIGYIDQVLKGMSKLTYTWTKDNIHHRFTRRCKMHHYREYNFR